MLLAILVVVATLRRRLGWLLHLLLGFTPAVAPDPEERPTIIRVIKL